MSDELPAGLSYCAFWVGADLKGIPAVSARAMIRDDARAARETAEFEAERADQRGAEAYMARIDGRERIGLQGVFAAAERYASAEDYRAERQAERDRYDPEPVSRSAFPATNYELDAQLERASEAHRELVAYRARLDYGAAETAARAKSAQRSQYQPGGEITRTANDAIVSVRR